MLIRKPEDLHSVRCKSGAKPVLTEGLNLCLTFGYIIFTEKRTVAKAAVLFYFIKKSPAETEDHEL